MPKREVKKDRAAIAAAVAEPVAQVVERIVERIVEKPIEVKVPVRKKMPRTRMRGTCEFRVAGCKGFVTVGEYDDGRPGEIFLKVAKPGSTLAGVMDAFSISISYGLQYGVPPRAFVEAFTNTRFEPAGMTDDPDLRIASSLLDYVFRRLAVDYLSTNERVELGVPPVSERMQPTLPGVEETAIETRQGSDVPRDPKSIPSASELEASLAAADAPAGGAPSQPSLLG